MVLNRLSVHLLTEIKHLSVDIITSLFLHVFIYFSGVASLLTNLLKLMADKNVNRFMQQLKNQFCVLLPHVAFVL